MQLLGATVGCCHCPTPLHHSNPTSPAVSLPPNLQQRQFVLQPVELLLHHLRNGEGPGWVGHMVATKKRQLAAADVSYSAAKALRTNAPTSDSRRTACYQPYAPQSAHLFIPSPTTHVAGADSPSGRQLQVQLSQPAFSARSS
jgi:hypothetical protein